jgi:16S rRNA (guanine527-N7)-methyltransferase
MTAAVAEADLQSQLVGGLAALQLELPEGGVEKLLRFIALLQKWNRTYNLTAIREPEKMVSLHLLDSLAVAPVFKSGSVLDVGSGGGFPGIPVAIARPDLRVTLLDASHKRAAFLRQVAVELDLRNVSVICERVENCGGETFDWIVSRAFAELRDFVASCAPLLKSGGLFAAMKGAIFPEEIAALPAAFRVHGILPLFVPGLDAERHVILVERS